MWETGKDSLGVDRAAGRVYFTAFAGVASAATLLSGLLTGTTHDRTYLRGTDPGAVGETLADGLNLVDHYDAAISPDGARLAYCADHGTGFHRVYAKNNNPSETASQTRRGDVYCGDPSWSPDGTFLVHTRALASTFGGSFYSGDIIRSASSGAIAEQNLTSAHATLRRRCGQAVVYEAPDCPSGLVGFTIARAPTGVTLTWPATPGLVYQVEYSTEPSGWQADLSGSERVAEAGQSTLSFTDPAAGANRRVYRVKVTCP